MATLPEIKVGVKFDPKVPTSVSEAVGRVREAVPSLSNIMLYAVILAMLGPHLVSLAGGVVILLTAYKTVFRKRTGKAYVPL